nr:hypothetical protein HK105_003090 [Polyrhizophydium stewartii]
MHRSSSVLPAPQAPPFDPAVLNPNLIDSQVTVITTPAGKTQYAIKAVAGFDIPWAFSMSDLDLTFTFGVYSLPAPSGNPATAPHHLIDVSVTPGALHAGPQNSLLISALTDHEHTDMLMALVGQLADGIDAAVSVQDIRISYLRGRSPLPWLEDLAAFIKFDLTLPGVSDLVTLLDPSTRLRGLSGPRAARRPLKRPSPSASSSSSSSSSASKIA